MGTKPFIKHKKSTNLRESAENFISALPVRDLVKVHLKFDAGMFIVVIFLLVIGLLMVFSASWVYSLNKYGSVGYILGRQMIWAAIGIVFAFIINRFDYHRLQRVGPLLMAVTLILLIAVLIFGEEKYGATRAFFNGSIQPSELAKLTIIIYLSVWLYSKRDQLHSIWLGLIPMAVILGFTTALVLFQRDLSATATIYILGVLLFYLADSDTRQIVIVVVVSLLAGWLFFKLHPKGIAKLQDFIAGLQDPNNASFHIQRSVEAIVRGNLFGVGIGKSQVKYTGLPVPWTDSIFAVIIEETGLVGAISLVSMYLVLLWRGLSIAHQAPDQLGKLLAGGITLWITLEALINMSVMANLMPFAGNALPLISFGGSSMVTTLAGIGIILSVSRATHKNNRVKERRSGAVVDLRRWDGRRRVSSPRRSASIER